MDNNLVNKYYNKILGYCSYYNKKRSTIKNKDHIVSILEEIINNKNHNLLTNSLLNYLCSCSLLIMDLDTLSSDKISDQIYVLSDYYREIIVDILNKKNTMYLILQDEDTKCATIKAANLIKEINDDYNYKYMGNKLLIKRIIYILLCYCHINSKMNDFCDLLDKTINDINLIIDDLELNGLEKLDDVLTSRIIEILGNKNKILIK